MRLLALPLTLFVLASCQQGPSPVVTPVPGQGAISIQVVPNPIVAKRTSGDTYDFPFEVVVRETGGRSVNVNRVTARVMLPGGFPVANESWDAERIRSMGFGTTLAANGELRYRFSPRKDVPDDRLFNGVSAALRVDATDDTGKATEATTTVTVTR